MILKTYLHTEIKHFKFTVKQYESCFKNPQKYKTLIIY